MFIVYKSVSITSWLGTNCQLLKIEEKDYVAIRYFVKMSDEIVQ